MPVKFSPLIAKSANVDLIDDEVITILSGVGDGYLEDFEKTTQTWKNKPDFKTELKKGVPKSVNVSTTDEIYGYVSGGTAPHKIISQKGLAFNVPSKAKTTPRVIGSTRGSRGKNKIYTRVVNHPGIKAREFDITIKKKWKPKTVKAINTAYKLGFEKTGHTI